MVQNETVKRLHDALVAATEIDGLVNSRHSNHFRATVRSI